MNRLKTRAAIIAVLLFTNAFPQEGASRKEGVITGKIYDAAQNKPIEFANAILFSQSDSVLITGAASGTNGEFRLGGIAPGRYYLETQIIGYKKKRVRDIFIAPDKPLADVGKILIQQATLNLEGIEVQGEALPISYQLDKKVINVGKQQTAASGTVVDVLENVPSITVDIEGNVSMRGSSNFTLLVDGRPSILAPNEALQQIPASTVENIEIITNPSAKHNPEGASGIINIILKKDRREGRSGMANLNAGKGDRQGGDFLYEYKNSRAQATFAADFNRRQSTGEEREDNRTTSNGRNSLVTSVGDSRREDDSFGARSELRWEPGARNVFGLSARYGKRDSERGAFLDYAERTEASAEALQYKSSSERYRDRIFFGTALTYQHRFAPQGHELSAEIFFSRREGDEATTNSLRTLDETILSARRTTEAGPSREWRTKLDYSLATGEKGKFEAGYQSELERSEDRTSLAEYEAASNAYVLQPQFDNLTRYDENVHALYAVYASAWKNTGIQIGLRGELTDRTIFSASSAQNFSLAQWDYFPTLHVSQQFTAGHQAMASYTRRIDRPGGGDLEPFLTWTDAYNVRVGNPALRSEYIDSYELGYQMNFAKSLWSLEGYYRKAKNKIEDVRSVYADNVTLHSAANIGTDYALGGEFLLNYDFSENWTLNLTSNVYQYRIEGVLFEENFARESFNWNARLSNSIKLGEATQIQFDGQYNSPSISTQGRREGYFTAHAALKRELIAKVLSATLQVRDVFRSAKNENASEGPGFYNYNYSKREAPVVMLNLRYNFNNYKADRNSRRDGADDEEEN